MGYDGLRPSDRADRAARPPAPSIQSYLELRQRLEAAGLGDVGITTNVAATSGFDPSSADPDQRARRSTT